MPLVPTIAADAILKLTDASRLDFAGWPPDAVTVGLNWAGVAEAYFAGLGNPIPLPGAIATASAAFAQAMTGALGPPGGPTGVTALQAGFTAFAVALVPLCAPYVVIPPPAPLVVVPGPPTADPNPPAQSLALAIDAWARTGTASIPPLPPVPWL